MMNCIEKRNTMERKYEFTDEIKYIGGVKLHRIRATEDNAHVPAGTLGGWIEKPWNMLGDAWVADEGCVYGDAAISSGALVSGHAQVYGNARVVGDAIITDNSQVFDKAYIIGDVIVRDNASVYGNAELHSTSRVYGNARVHGYSYMVGGQIFGNAELFSNSYYKRAGLWGSCVLSGDDKKIVNLPICTYNDTENEIPTPNDDEMEEDDE